MIFTLPTFYKNADKQARQSEQAMSAMSVLERRSEVQRSIAQLICVFKELNCFALYIVVGVHTNLACDF